MSTVITTTHQQHDMTTTSSTTAAMENKEEASTPTDEDEANTEKNRVLRVKLYHLNDEGKWDDKGTGYLQSKMIKMSKQLIMLSENDKATLLETPVSKDEIYQLQGESLIVWCDVETSMDMALSFQESEGCQHVWDQIRELQGKKPDSKERITKNLQEEKESEEAESTEEPVQEASLELPEAAICNLAKILETLSKPTNKTKLGKIILETGYLDKLFETFDKCEDVEDVESLRTLFSIFKTTVLLDDSKLFEALFTENRFLRLMGALEYDPDLPVPKSNHRHFLKNVVVYKEIIPFSNRDIVAKIHQTFKIQYLKDTVLPRYLDDPTFNTLNTIIYFNNLEIIKCIREDEKFLTQLFALLQECNSNSKRKDLIRFLQEYNTMLKSVQPYYKTLVYKTLLDHGLLSVLESFLLDKDEAVRHSCAEIVCSLINHDAVVVREFILEEHREKKLTFLSNFIKGIIEETELGVQDNLTEGLKTLADPETLQNLKDDFLNMLYSDFVDMIVSPLNAGSTNTKEAKIHVLDLLSYFVQHHSYRSKNHILRNNVLLKAVGCIKTKEKDLILAVIRFMRSCVGLKDIFYNLAIIRHDLFDPIMEVWRENSSKYNLINSAIIELFEFISANDIKNLISHVVEKYRDDVAQVKYVETFQALLNKYQQHSKSNTTNPTTNSTTNASQTAQEEAYYFDDDDEKGQNGKSKLVSYGSDDEESNDSLSSVSNHIADMPLPSVASKHDDDDDDAAVFKFSNTPPSTPPKEQAITNKQAPIEYKIILENHHGKKRSYEQFSDDSEDSDDSDDDEMHGDQSPSKKFKLDPDSKHA